MNEMDVLFEGYEPAEAISAPTISAGRRLTVRQGEAIAAGRHPLTGRPIHELASRYRDAASPKNDPFTCGSCWFRAVVRYHGKSYPKCLFDPKRGPNDTLDMYARVSHSTATDVRSWWPACRDYSPSDSLSDDAARWTPTPDAPPHPASRVSEQAAAGAGS